MKIQIIILICLLTSVVSVARAAQTEMESYQGSAPQIVDLLIKQGVTSVNGLDLAAIRKNLPTVRWRALAPGETVPDFVGHRTTAFYRTKNKVVTIMAKPRYMNKFMMAVIALHESLGALGYDDHKYQMSIGLGMMALTTGNPADDQVKRASESKLVQVAMGGFSVGGGGDFLGLAAKMGTMEQFMRIFHGDIRNLQRFIALDFEADYKAKSEFEFHVSFDKEGKPIFQVPALAWNTDDRKLLDTAANYAVTLAASLFQDTIPLLPEWKPRATIHCKRAAGPLYYSDVSPTKGLEFLLRTVFDGENCRFEMNNDGQ